MWSSASPRRWAAATAISSRSLTFAWPVKSEKRDGRNVSSNAASGLFNVEIGRSAIARQNARMPNQRQGERADRRCERRISHLLPLLPGGGYVFSHSHARNVLRQRKFWRPRRFHGSGTGVPPILFGVKIAERAKRGLST